MNIIADNTIPYLKGIIEPIANITYLSSGQFTKEAIQNADALIVRSIDKCTQEILTGSQVKLITTATIGFDHIDTDYCEKAGITWYNAPGSNALSVAQYLISSLVTLSIESGEPLSGKTIGIIGVGHVGKQVEKLCTALGMNILRNDPPRAEQEGDSEFVSLQTIAQKADIITLHTPLTREGKHKTYHLANQPFLDSLQKRPWFINASRGAVHDTEALLNAHQSGKIGALVIDCWEKEPDIHKKLLEIAAIATPHIAGFSADGKANATRMCLEHISRFFQVEITSINKVVPLPPSQPIIDLNRFDTKRVENAILSTFNPLKINSSLRENPEKFEWFRAHYEYPREFNAYTILNATPEETIKLEKLGFNTL